VVVGRFVVQFPLRLCSRSLFSKYVVMFAIVY
jgi:hypothetical protein